MVSGRVVFVPQYGTPQSIMDRWDSTSPEEGVKREVPRVTVLYLADSEEMSDSASAQVVHQNLRRCTFRLMWADGAQEHGDAPCRIWRQGSTSGRSTHRQSPQTTLVPVERPHHLGRQLLIG